MRKQKHNFLVAALLLPCLMQPETSRAQARAVYLNQLYFSTVNPKYNKVIKNKSFTGTGLQIANEKYDRGVGAQESSLIEVLLNKGSERFGFCQF